MTTMIPKNNETMNDNNNNNNNNDKNQNKKNDKQQNIKPETKQYTMFFRKIASLLCCALVPVFYC